MNPQPPVTRMRMAARTSSAERSALAESAPVTPRLRGYVEQWKLRFAEMDWVPWLIIALAAFLRFFLLGIKPPHFDEGINGWFVDQVMHNGFYRYDPTNYHGPLHFYVLLLFESLFGRNLWALRLPVVLVSIACVWLVFKFEPLVGRAVSRIAALAMAVSPGFVFYGRYAIHEVWLQFFSMLFILGLLGLWKRGTLTYLWYAGMGVTGMILTKETYAIHVVCAMAAIPVLVGFNWLSRIPDAKPAKQTWSWVDLGMIVIVGGFAVIFFYSGTFFNWSGVKGLYLAFKAWSETGAAGHGHEKAWDYWLKLMGPSWEVRRADFFGYELPMLAGLILSFIFGVAILLRRQFCQKFNLGLRYLAIYGVGSLVVYSYVKYKTPWCIVSFGWPFLFVFGGAILLVRPKHLRTAQWTIGVILAISLVSSIWLNYFRCSSPDEPYAYVQTYNDMFKLTKPLLTLAKRDPSNYHLTGHLIRSSVYPLPWVFGDFDRIGYYEGGNMPANIDGDFLLVQQDKIKDVESKLKGTYFTEMMTLRNYQEPSKIFFSATVFKDLFPGRKPEFVGGAQKSAPTPAPSKAR
jgi:uncharacterized protein (TIGR03663 family)